jgi:hypothetical protein
MTANGNYKRNDRGTVNTSPGRSDIYQVDATGGREYPGAGIYVPDNREFNPIGTLKLQPGHKYDLVVRDVGGKLEAKIDDQGLKSVTESIRVDLFAE